MSKRGRPSRFPTDFTPWDGPKLDPRARAAWLLRVWRLASLSTLSLSEFAVALRQHQITADASRVSGWESGRSPLSVEVVLAYEQILQLPHGQMLGPITRLRATRSQPTGQGPQQDLDDAFAPIMDRTPTGLDWLHVANLLTTPGMHVPSRLFEEPARHLALETMRSVGAAFTTRAAALHLLVSNSPLSAVVIDQALDITLERNAQTVVDLVGAVAWSRHRSHVEHALTLLSHENPRIRLGIALGLAERNRAVGLGAELNDLALQLVSPADQATREALTPLLSGRSVASAPEPAPTLRSISDLVRQVARAGRTDTGIEDDPMVERLVRESCATQLGHRQDLANLLLSHSPYRATLARVARQLLDEPLPEPLAVRLSDLLTWVAGPEDTDWLVDKLDHPQHVLATAAAMGLAHSSGVPTSLDLASLQLRHLDRARLLSYAAGMSQHPVLDTWSMAGELQGPAQWWKRTGGAVFHRAPIHRAPALNLGYCAVAPVRPTIRRGLARRP